MLEDTLAQSAEQVNVSISRYLENTEEPPAIQLQEKGKYALEQVEIDGVPVLSTKFSGLFTLPRGPVGTETLGTQILDSEALYSVTLTFPDNFKTEMVAVWASFQESVRIRK